MGGPGVNSGRVGVLTVVGGKASGKVLGPRKLEPERGEPGPGWGPEKGRLAAHGRDRRAHPQVTLDFTLVTTRKRALFLIAAGGTGLLTTRTSR